MKTAKDTEVYLRVPPEQAPNGFEKIEGRSIFTRPTLLVCGGVMVSHQHPELANGYCKKALALLNCLDTNGHSGFQTASVSYAQAHTVSEAIRAFNSGHAPKDTFSDFVEEQLKPLFLNDKGQRLDLQTVKKNFRNINVVTHSYGGIFIQQVGNVLVEQMQTAGFNEKEIDEATKQILVVTAGSIGPFMKGKAKFTQFDIVQRHDKIVKNYSRNLSIVEALITEPERSGSLAAIKFRYGDNPYDIQPDPQASEMIICTGNKNEPPIVGTRYDDAKREAAPQDLPDADFHNCPTYFNFSFDSYGLMLRTILSTALSNGLNSSIENNRNPEHFTPLPAHEELLMLSQKQEFEYDRDKDFRKIAKMIGYNERINNMLGNNTPSQQL